MKALQRQVLSFWAVDRERSLIYDASEQPAFNSSSITSDRLHMTLF